MEGLDFTEFTDDELDRLLTEIETDIGSGRAVQATALIEVDRRQTATADGCRSLVEWATGRLDVAPETARALVATARRLQDLPLVEKTAAAGELSFDRIAAVAQLIKPGKDEAMVLAETAGFDVAGIRGRSAQRRRLTKDQEQRAFRDRYLSLQPNLDESAWRLHGQLAGSAGAVVERALNEVGDRLPATPRIASRATRNADALWQIAQDAIDGGHSESAAAATPRRSTRDR